MKVLYLVAVLSVLSSMGCQDKSRQVLHSVYGLRHVLDISLTLSDASQDSLRRQPKEWTEAKLTYQGDDFTVGVRLKGNRSLRPFDQKPSFKIKMNFRQSKQRFLGRKTIVLNNLAEDPTLAREIVAYRLFRMLGVPAPSAGFARVFVNGQYRGLYLFLEPIDQTFLRNSLHAKTGELYEGEFGCDLHPEDAADMEQDWGKDNRQALRAVAQAVQSTPAAQMIGEGAGQFHPTALTYLAISAAIGDFDGYRHSHNYQLFRHGETNQWYFIPWGLDRSFKKHLQIFDSYGVLAEKCFAEKACRIMYLREITRVADAMESLKLEQAVDVIWAVTKSAMMADTRADYDLPKMKKSRQEMREFVISRVDELRTAARCLHGDTEIDSDGDGYGCMDCNDKNAEIHPGRVEACDGVDNDCNGLVDDSATCPCELSQIGELTFGLCNLKLSWGQAEAHCVAQGGHLARFDSISQVAQIATVANKIEDERWWIGLNDSSIEGDYSWSDETPATFFDWARGDPDNTGCSQDCVALQKGGRGKWQDTHCNQRLPFVCQYPAR